MRISLTELRQLLAEDALVAALLIERAALKQQILDLLAGDADTAAKVESVFSKSEAIEAKMRGAVAGR